MPRPTLISLGYEGRTADELIAALVRQNVRVLVDVRLTALSRKPGLSKRRLADALRAANISYVHLPALGNPKANRDPFRAGDPKSRRLFRTLLSAQPATDALDHVAGLLDDGAVAILCFERDHRCCHRHLVAEALQAVRPAVELVEV
jgi:uncharacterized protein (DUF488 family)